MGVEDVELSVEAGHAGGEGGSSVLSRGITVQLQEYMYELGLIIGSRNMLESHVRITC